MDLLREDNSQIRTVRSLEIDVCSERVSRVTRKDQETPTNASMISKLNPPSSLKDFTMNADLFSRRNFLQCSAVAVAAGSVVNGAASALAHPISASLAVAEAFGVLATLHMRQIKAQDEASKTLASLRDTLLPILLSGELSVSDIPTEHAP